MRKAVHDGTEWKGGQAGVRSLESDPRLDCLPLGPWAASCPLWSRPAAEEHIHPLTPEPSGQMLLRSQETNAPFSFTRGRRKSRAHQTYNAVIPALRQENGELQAILVYVAKAHIKQNKNNKEK